MHQQGSDPRGSGRRIAVFGATGSLGRPAVSRFLEDGHAVTAVVRNPGSARLPEGAHAVRGDITDRDSVVRALHGCDAVHVSVNGGTEPVRIHQVEHDGVRNVIAAAEQAGVDRITMISGMNASSAHADHPGEAAKVGAEAALAASTVATTVFRPGFFAETLARFCQGPKVQMIGSQPHPLRIVVADDLMRNVSRSFGMPETANRTYTVLGAEPPMTLCEALERYVATVRPGDKVSVVPVPMMKVINRLFLKGSLTRTIGTMQILQRTGEEGDPAEYFATFGPARTTFDEWLGEIPAVDPA